MPLCSKYFQTAGKIETILRTNMLSILVTIICLHLTYAIDHPEELVNLLAGSFTDGDRFSTGNTLPLIGRPWGFNHWSPQTKDGNRHTGSWWFKGSDHQFTWLRCTHQPSPWIGDWGWFIFSPIVGHVTRNPTHFWEPRGAVLKPYLLDATVAPYGIRMELTPTDHGAFLRVTFPSSEASGDRQDRHICFAEARWDGAQGVNSADGTGRFFEGRATQVNSDRMLVSNFAMHIRAESAEATKIVNHDDMRCFTYDQSATVVTVRIATSLISSAQALVNLRRELRPKKSFDAIALDAKMVWNKLLKRADVVDAGDVGDATNRHLDVFYTGLYRALTFPRRMDEVDERGNMVHYSPYDPRGGTHPGPLVTDNGFWDTFRTVYPLLSLVYPDHLGTIIQGWLNAYKEGGWLPTWASPGYRNCMVGTFADVVVADAIVKGVSGFDLALAKDALMKDSFNEPPPISGGSMGKVGLRTYTERGFVPTSSGGSDAVSRTLDYGFADFSTAQAFRVLAKKLGDDTGNTALAADLRQKADTLMKRAVRAYSSLFDRNVGLMVPRTGSGQISPGFTPIEWGKGYTEGNAWHHSFPPYAISNALGQTSAITTLADLYGGKSAMLAKLHEMLVVPSSFRVGSYNQEIHEMTEMRALAMGQYGHNNQPCHHILYMFALLGDAPTTQRTVRAVMDRAYGRDFYAGDEDNGEQGAWYALSALGLYVTTPGTTEYVLGSPVFRHVRISRAAEAYDPYYETSYEQQDQHRPGYGAVVEAGASDKAAKSYLDIIALGTGPGSVYVDQITLNNIPLGGATVDDSALQTDAVLRFIMRGEENSHDVEHRVAAVHMMSTEQLESRLRSTSTSAAHVVDAEPVQKHLRLEEGLHNSAATIEELNKEIAQLKLQSGGEGESPVVASISRPFLVAPAAPSATLTTGHHRNSTIFVVFFYLFVLLLGVELLDFMFYITKSPYQRSTQTGAPDISPVRGASSPSEDFELVQNTQTGVNTGDTVVETTAAASTAGTAVAQSLDTFLSPVQLPPTTPTVHTGAGGSSVLSDYLATRRYGRGAIACVVVLFLGAAQVCSEVYWRAYFCSWARKPRSAESSGVFGMGASAVLGGMAGGGGSSGLPSRRSRKQVAHTV